MRYQITQKVLALGDDFTIEDEDGTPVYLVDGKAMSIGDKLSFQDLERNELAFIRQKVLAFRPTYEIHRGGEKVATVTKQLFTPFKARFELDLMDVPGTEDMLAEGDLLHHEYRFTRGGETVATVSKKWLSVRDRYGVDVAPGEDDVLVLAAAVVIDLVSHDQDR